MRKTNKVAVAIVAMFAIACLTLTTGVFAQAGGGTGGVEKTKPAPKMEKAVMKGALDGKHFAGTCGMDGKTDGDKETVSFSNGMLRSSYCMSKGFKAAPYTTEMKEGVTSFKSEQTDPKMGHLVWEGSIKGETLTADGTLTPSTGEPSKMWIKAEAKATQHAAHTATKKK